MTPCGQLMNFRTGWRVAILLVALLAPPFAQPLIARDRLGVYHGWAAFRDVDAGRCYAIAIPSESIGEKQQDGYFSIGFWPKRNVGHQIYVRMARVPSTNSAIVVSVGGRRFRLKQAMGGAFAVDRHMDLAIIAAMRSATSMSVEALGRNGRPIVDAYLLRGAPSAIDAAAIGCLPGQE